ncbi:hypothetical protein L917_21375 [Phytophthora nicotianae]|uniref:Ubiquitin-like protease family profile domain-containing protein n=2 Tax=Phytophthora nicotianae TaxID=4792 RepID=W2JXV8_PHYNI|nr:hypothetical protein L917_21375 [Phytophthora nicotianae]
MPQTGVTVQAGGVVYNVSMLKAMRSWQTAIFRFVGIESAMKWVEKYDETAWTTDDSIWTEGVADKATLIDFLKQVNVLGDIYDATGFCGQTPLESSSMDLGMKAIIQRHSEEATMFTVPSEILRYPRYDTKAIQDHPVWSKLKMAAASMDLSRDSSVKLFFIGVIHYDWNHWCAVGVNFKTSEVVIYDPQNTGHRFDAIKGFLKTQVLPLLTTPNRRSDFGLHELTWRPNSTTTIVECLCSFSSSFSCMECK